MEELFGSGRRSAVWRHVGWSLIASGLCLVAPVAAAQVPDQQAQATATRSVPARTLPVPSDLDDATRALVAAPYSSFWNLNPPDDNAWRSVLNKAADAAVPRLAATRRHLGVTMTPITLGGVKAFILEPTAVPAAHRRQLILHIHGGGYVFGARESGTGEAAIMAAYGGYRVIAVDYRMPPDAPFPAALDDLVAAWRTIIRTTDPSRIAIEGTSTGGSLTLALVLRLKAEGLPLPGAIAPGSPWSDLTPTGDSYATNEWIDNVVVTYHGYLERAAKLYAHGHDLRDPLLSPVYGDMHDFPPTILTSGTRDLFLSNTVRVHRKLRQAGVEAQLEVFEGLSHAQFNIDPYAPVTREAYGEIAHFLDGHLKR